MKRAIYGRVLILLLSCFTSLIPVLSYAQSDETSILLRGSETAALIRANPADPQPGDTVHFSVDAPLHDLAKSSITWTIDGEVVAEGIGMNATDYSLGLSGDAIDVAVTIADPVWGNAAAAITIVPLQLDLIFDSPTYVPAFYRGRAMPSPGGVLRLQAIARFPGTRGYLDESVITYTWSRNSQVLGSVSGKGRSSITIDAPLEGDVDTISVRASANDGTLSAVASAKIPATEPVLMLYEDQPLFGILFHSAFASEIPTRGDTTVAAIPYFVTAQRLDDQALRYAWKINNQTVTASSTKKNEMTLHSDNGALTLELGISHATNFFLDSIRSWKFLFGTAGGSIGTAPSPQDMFHSNQQ